MCDTTAYARAESGDETVLENVDVIRPGDGVVYLRNLFGEELTFAGRIVEISLMKHRLVLERA